MIQLKQFDTEIVEIKKAELDVPPFLFSAILNLLYSIVHL
jgi:hypothetical protein